MEPSTFTVVPKPDGKWRFTLDFVQLNACTGALEGWPIPNISDTLKRIGDHWGFEQRKTVTKQRKLTVLFPN